MKTVLKGRLKIEIVKPLNIKQYTHNEVEVINFFLGIISQFKNFHFRESDWPIIFKTTSNIKIKSFIYLTLLAKFSIGKQELNFIIPYPLLYQFFLIITRNQINITQESFNDDVDLINKWPENINLTIAISTCNFLTRYFNRIILKSKKIKLQLKELAFLSNENTNVLTDIDINFNKTETFNKKEILIEIQNDSLRSLSRDIFSNLSASVIQKNKNKNKNKFFTIKKIALMHIPIKGKVIAGHLLLSINELEALRIGDILLPNGWDGEKMMKGNVFIELSENLSLSAVFLSEKELTITNKKLISLQPIYHDLLTNKQPIDSNEDRNLNIQILLSFHIGNVYLSSVGIYTNSMMKMECLVSNLIFIYIENKLIIKGKLVEFNEGMGVQIVELLNNK